MRTKTSLLALIITTALAASASAQTPVDPGPGPIVIGAMAGGPPVQEKGRIVTMSVDAMDAAPVKGAPFCATITTEHTQPFADGNRIHTTDSSTMCRDSEGRTRRDSGLNLLGAAPQKSGTRLIAITDPVVGFRYMLDGESKTAHKVPLPHPDSGTPAGANVADAGGPHAKEHFMMYRTTGDAGPGVNFFYKNESKSSDETPPTTEQLGDQTIEGVHATGTRVTTTIPAGQMGNEQPITVTSERWYSPELKVTVMTRHNDPWAGELKTQFTNVNTSEPDRSLFVVPSDYKVVEDKAGPLMMHLPPTLPAAPPQ